MSALASVVPELGHCACVVRRSTSTGLSNADTGERYPGSEGLHIYVLVADGADIPRALQAWHDRCWLAGFGWSMVGAGGALSGTQPDRPHGGFTRKAGVRRARRSSTRRWCRTSPAASHVAREGGPL